MPGRVAERCPKLKCVEGTYDRYDYYEERKQALIKVVELVEPVINEAPKIP